MPFDLFIFILGINDPLPFAPQEMPFYSIMSRVLGLTTFDSDDDEDNDITYLFRCAPFPSSDVAPLRWVHARVLGSHFLC